MGFLDKAKENLEKVAKQGQDKLDEVQSKKKADAMLRDLGAWTYASSTGRDNGQGPAQVARITAELKAHEAEHGPLGSDDADKQAEESTKASDGVKIAASAPPKMVSPVVPPAPPAPAGIVPPPPPASDHGTAAGQVPPAQMNAPIPPPLEPAPESGSSFDVS